MSGAPAASSAAAAGKKEEEAKEGEGEESQKAQPKGGAWWQWLLVGTLLSYAMTPASMLYPPRASSRLLEDKMLGARREPSCPNLSYPPHAAMAGDRDHVQQLCLGTVAGRW